MSKLYDVVIAGAGPIGLFLSCEVALSGASVLVLERDLSPSSPWKEYPLGLRGLNTRSAEAFYRRGLLSRLREGEKVSPAIDLGKKPGNSAGGGGSKFAGHFAGIMFDATKFDLDRFPYTLDGPALIGGHTSLARVQSVLTQRAEELGVEIRWGQGVTGIVAQDATSVTVEANANECANKELFRSRWLVGCDGGRSTVRKAAGFEFVGTEPKMTSYAMQCELANIEVLERGVIPSGAGLYILPPTFGWGLAKSEQTAGTALYLIEHDNGAFDRSQEPTQDHLQSVLERVTERKDVKITKVYRVGTSTDRSKQTTQYRRGRVLLAGDASHIHPPLGGQGLNLGLDDAMNLGWKLGAAIRKEVSGGSDFLDLLDTYEHERMPFGTRLLDYTRAQVVAIQPDAYGRATRAILRELIGTPDALNYLIGRAWGFTNRYPLGDDDTSTQPVVGCSVPDFELADGSRLGPKMYGGKGLLVDFGGDAKLQALLGEDDKTYSDRVDYLALSAKNTCGLGALLVRPDGAVAWAVDEGADPDVDAARAALARWFAF
ncbi:putative pentachlorophenol 4-monooxygenase [Xylariaceae sp. AK1471]|nr:putative pentachlorophenol 4-monooxygenase [Xylariaceae sp. AK1471]